jgi:hypothetical protein
MESFMSKRPAPLCRAFAAACLSTVWSALTPPPSAAQPAGGDGTAPVTACSVLTREEITRIVGQDPGDPRPSGSGDSTICYWEAASPNGSVVLHTIPPGNYQSMSAALQAMIQHGRKARMVKVLGEEAIFWEQSDGIASGTLYVKVGQHTLTIWRQALPSGTAESVLPTLTALANVAIPKLR